jgi:hypothetical protein
MHKRGRLCHDFATDNTTHVNHLTTISSNLNWFWFTDAQDKTTMTKTDLQN